MATIEYVEEVIEELPEEAIFVGVDGPVSGERDVLTAEQGQQLLAWLAAPPCPPTPAMLQIAERYKRFMSERRAEK